MISCHRNLSWTLLAATLATVRASTWEWAGVFPFPETGHFVWSAARGSGGEYADASMKMVIVSTSSASAAGIEEAEASAESLWDMEAIPRLAGEELGIGSPNVLQFDQDSWVTHFKLHVGQPGALVFFAQHFPVEFEREFHYLRNARGEDVEPSAEESGEHGEHEDEDHADEDVDKIGEVLLGCFLTCIPAMIAIAFLACQTHGTMQKYQRVTEPIINSFACGVILSAGAFLLMPESMHLAFAGHDEVTGIWTWGVALMSGWLAGVLISHASDIAAVYFGATSDSPSSELDTAQPQDSEAKKIDVAPEGNKDATSNRDKLWASIAGPVIFGDMFHNLSDGFVLGVAFKSCSASFAWGMVGVTIAHELPQELADFVILVNKAGMRWYTAVTANFLSSLSTVLGGAISYRADLEVNAQGLILAMGAGVYLYVSMTELGPSVKELATGKCTESLVRVVSFILGTVCIGLVLIGHEHCVPEGDGAEGDAHAGHGH